MKKIIITLAALAALSTAAFADSDASKFGVDNPGVVLSATQPAGVAHVKKINVQTLNAGNSNSLGSAFYSDRQNSETSRVSQ